MNFEEKELREDLHRFVSQMEDILNRAKQENRELTLKEQSKFDNIDDKATEVRRKLNDMGIGIKDNGRAADVNNPVTLPGMNNNRGHNNMSEEELNRTATPISEIGNNQPTPSTGGVETWRSISGPNEGQEIKVLDNTRSVKQEMDIEDGEQNWRDYMRNRIAGHTASTRDMSTTADSTLVPEPLSAQVIDLARNKSRIFQAGARTIPMSSKTLTIAQITGDATPEWKAENASHSSSDVNTAPLTFTAKTLVGSVKMSVELSEDAPNGSRIIRNSLANSLALELDRVGLVGSGTDPEPQGIYGATNVQVIDMGTDGAALTDYSNYSTAYQKVLEANGVPRSVIHAPRTFGALDSLTASDGQPLMAPQSYQNLQKLVTNQIPTDMTKGTSSDASIAIVGDFQQLMVGVRTNLKIEVTRVASDSTNSAWEDLQVWVRAYLRADIQLAHPDHFTVIDGIIPSA